MNESDGFEPDDLWVDHCLQEALGGETPPDLARRVGGATTERLAVAAAAVDAAEPAIVAPPPSVHRSRSWWLVAATLGVVGLGAWLLSGRKAPTVESRHQALLDEFHAVMPRNPALLRVPSWRERTAARAIPVLRAILAFDAKDTQRRFFGARVMEFEVYSAVLGDAGTLADLRGRAERGDGVAAGQLAIVAATLAYGDERVLQIDRIAASLAEHPDRAANLLWCLVVAEPTPAEVERLARVAAPELRSYLAQLADRTGGVAAWLDAPIELSGRLADDRLFSTAELRGKVVLVYFWATWCAPCAPFVDRVRTLHAKYPDLAIVGVSCDHDPGALQRHLEANTGDDWEQFFDASRPGWHPFALKHHVQAIPFAVLLDRDGFVREVDVDLHLEEAVARLLGR